MSPAAIQLVTVAAPTFTALLALISSVLNSRKIAQLHVDVNSRLTELLRATAAASHAEGRREGVESTKPTGA